MHVVNEGGYYFRFGRRKTIVWYAVMKIIGLLLSVLSSSYWPFVVGRFIIGMSTSGTLLPLFVLGTFHCTVLLLNIIFIALVLRSEGVRNFQSSIMSGMVTTGTQNCHRVARKMSASRTILYFILYFYIVYQYYCN